IRDRNVTGVQTCALPISDDLNDPARRPGALRQFRQTGKKVPSSRHVRMDGTHTGKLSAESVRGRKAECAVQRSILSPGGYQGEEIGRAACREREEIRVVG